MLDFLCIGAQKAGTSWLFSQLVRNPTVWVHPFKEMHFFDHLYCPENRSWTQWHLQQMALTQVQQELTRPKPQQRFDRLCFLMRSADREWTFTEPWYRYAFAQAPAGVLRGECTPEYAGIGPEGIAHVKRLMPDVRLIYLVRDPISRAWSQIRMNLGRGTKLKDTGETLERHLLEEVKQPAIDNRSNYARYIADWDRAFQGTDQLLYVPYGDIANDPDGVLGRIERHIGAKAGDRSRAKERVWESPSVAMPGSVRTLLEEKLEPQYQFLRQRFGTEFMAGI